MIDEQYINDTYFKRYSLPTNEHLLFLLPGQSISPRGFWDFKLPEGKTHSEYFVEAGIDVILFVDETSCLLFVDELSCLLSNGLFTSLDVI